jgi:hypothetical protein
MKPDDPRLSRRYAKLISSVSAALYESDPLFMGSKIGTPLDEYDDEAGLLARDIARLTDPNDVVVLVDKEYGAIPQLTSAIVGAWETFRQQGPTAVD